MIDGYDIELIWKNDHACFLTRLFYTAKWDTSARLLAKAGLLVVFCLYFK